MTLDVNSKPREWCNDIKWDLELEVDKLLGGLTSLIPVTRDPQLIKALLNFWDPMKMVFKFVDFELVPTIEEISDFMDLSYHVCERLYPISHHQGSS
ncbi:hypothetical protein KY284_035844 [Solanum tuberosum]|nr:hypothetical protein KY284_035844 [Solanum tuberosum]